MNEEIDALTDITSESVSRLIDSTSDLTSSFARLNHALQTKNVEYAEEVINDEMFEIMFDLQDIVGRLMYANLPELGLAVDDLFSKNDD